MPDYYYILGIDKNASQSDIKKAYRKLVLEAHPDKGGDKELFQQIQNAYETLSDTTARNNYDNPMHSNPFFSFTQTNVNSVSRKQDYFHNVQVSLADVYFGKIKKINIQKKVSCSCNRFCTVCDGNGQILHKFQFGMIVQIQNKKCIQCNGTGHVKITCSNSCDNGFVTEKKQVDLTIERGVTPDKFTFEGWGEQSWYKNEIPGNLIILVNLQKDEHFTKQNLNLFYKTSITLSESIIGKILYVPHFDANFPVDLKGFGIINPKMQYILYNKGFVSNDSIGNLHLQFDIIYPTVSLSSTELSLLSNIFDKLDAFRP